MFDCSCRYQLAYKICGYYSEHRGICRTLHNIPLMIGGLNMILGGLYMFLISQEGVFSAIGRPIIESCMCGYNGTIFA